MSIETRSVEHKKSPILDLHIIKKIRIPSIVEILARHYVWIIVVIGLLFIFLQTLEHQSPVGLSRFFYYDEVILIVLWLSITGLLTKTMLGALTKKNEAIQILKVKHDLGMELSASQDINELSSRIVRQLASILPSTEIKLFLYNKETCWFTLASAQGVVGGVHESSLRQGFDPMLCRRCFLQTRQSLHSLQSCKQSDGIGPIPKQNGYCLLLNQGTMPIGLLFFSPSPQNQLTIGEKDLLEKVSGDLSGSLQAVLAKKAREEILLTQKIHTIQLDIARDLHDTIGQNISYLRMMLEKLSDADLQGRSETAVEIRRMSDVANESYDLVRGTLAVLQSGSPTDLAPLFAKHGAVVAERSSIKISYTHHGVPKSLSAKKIRQLFYVFREALSNIEKHAHANQVKVDMNWKKDHLILTISDDGRGFDPQKLDGEDHYGLKFMHQRTEQIRGELSIVSELNLGTKILIFVPYE
jgi:signal transduction histidine kinase